MMPLRTAYSVLAALSPAAMACVACSFASLLGMIVGLMPAPAKAQTAVPIATAKSISPPAALNGTLFTTREQRERLDRVRSRGDMAEDDAEADTEPMRSVINGFVKRSDGRNTVWVDDIMKRDPRAEVAEQLEPNMVGGSAGSIKLTNAKSQPSSSATNNLILKHNHLPIKTRRKAKLRSFIGFHTK